MSEANVELARRGYTAARSGDFETVASLLDDDVRWHGGDRDAVDACHNRSEALVYMRRAVARGQIGELAELIDAGDRVVVVMAPPGQEELAANITTFRDGKVVEIVHYPDPADARAAAGV